MSDTTTQQQDGTPQSDTSTDQTTTATTTATSTDEKRFSQADLDAILKDRLERQRRAVDAEARKAAETAETKRLAEQQEFKALAERHEARVKELEPEAARAERYAAALTKHLTSQRQDLPAHITALLDKLDVAEQLEWIADNRDELVKAHGTSGAAIRETPRGTTTQETREERETRYRQRLASSGAYSQL